jgi:hypothetical protein
MNEELRSALLEFLNSVRDFILRHGSGAEQADILERWQELYEQSVVQNR